MSTRRIPDTESENRLLEIRRAASQSEALPQGVIPAGAPFPKRELSSGYYKTPLLKEPQWTPEVPLYFFVGGAGGAAALIASVADGLGGHRDLVKSARWMAAVSSVVSSGLLTSDLGVPSRFLNMLRVFKVKSPMSVGAWTLTAFSSFSSASAFADLLRKRLGGSVPVRVIQNAASTLAAATGLVMSSYTGVLVGATVIPVWNRHVATLPIHFAASGLNSAVSILELTGHDDSSALNLIGLGASVYETIEGALIETDSDRVNEPLKRGKSGLLVRAGGTFSGPVPLALRLAYLFTGNKKFRRAAAVAGIAGSVLTRFGWVEAGKSSARDYSIPLNPSSAATISNG